MVVYKKVDRCIGLHSLLNSSWARLQKSLGHVNKFYDAGIKKKSIYADLGENNIDRSKTNVRGASIVGL